jgi:hypothetical protein
MVRREQGQASARLESRDPRCVARLMTAERALLIQARREPGSHALLRELSTAPGAPRAQLVGMRPRLLLAPRTQPECQPRQDLIASRRTPLQRQRSLPVNARASASSNAGNIASPATANTYSAGKIAINPETSPVASATSAAGAKATMAAQYRFSTGPAAGAASIADEIRVMAAGCPPSSALTTVIAPTAIVTALAGTR